MTFIKKVLDSFIQICKDFGLSDNDIKDGIDKSLKIFKTIDFEDKDHAKTISDAMQNESKKLGGKK